LLADFLYEAHRGALVFLQSALGQPVPIHCLNNEPHDRGECLLHSGLVALDIGEPGEGSGWDFDGRDQRLAA
jgi:hypothetical protein